MSAPTGFRGAQRGFTLVEVLVALVIVALGMAALFTTTNQAVLTTSYLRERTFAQWIALNRITEVRVRGQIPGDEEMEGEVEFAGRQWRWELETIPTPVEGIFRLEARAAPEEAPEDSWPGQATGFMGKAIAEPNSPAIDWLGTRSAAGQPPPSQVPRDGSQPPEENTEPGTPGTPGQSQ